MAQPDWDNPAVYRLNKVQPHDRICPAGNWHRLLDSGWRRSRPTTAMQEGELAYSCTFQLPTEWSGRRTIAKFPTSGAALYLFVNDHRVGYSQDSRTPAEWDITRYLQPGSNRIAYRLLPTSDGSLLEYPLPAATSPLSLELISLPSTYISDIKIVATLDTLHPRTGHLDLMLDFNREVQAGSIVVEMAGQRQRKVLEPRDWFVGLQFTINNVAPWSPTSPTLYPLTIRLLDAGGKETECIVKKVGFRNIHCRDGRLFLNGRQLRIMGFRPSPTDFDTLLQAASPTMVAAIQGYLSRGFNVLHLPYPAAERWYDLCDSLGLMLFDQANLQTDSLPDLSRNSDYLNPILDRLFNLYRRDRNHPSVIAWSLASGEANGWCMEEAYRFLKGKDNSRLVVYPGASLAFNSDITLPPLPSLHLPTLLPQRNSRPYLPLLDCDASPTLLASIRSTLLSRSFFLADGDAELPQLAYLPEPKQQSSAPEPTAPATDAAADLPLPLVMAAVCHPAPTGHAPFPYALTDGLYADPHPESDGWVEWTSADTVSLVLALHQRMRLGEVAVSLLHSLHDSLPQPTSVQVRWSVKGRHWSRWHSLTLQNAPSDSLGEGVSLRYAYSPWSLRSPQFVALRFIFSASASQHLMVDEIEINGR